MKLSDPQVKKMLLRHRYKNYDGFFASLSDNLDEIIDILQASLNKMSRLVYDLVSECEDEELCFTDNQKRRILEISCKHLEDDMSVRIRDILAERGFKAIHDGNHNGHVDLLVKSHDEVYQWFGEAKIYDGLVYTQHGFNQLNNRYSTGTSKTAGGGLIIYLNSTRKTVVQIMKEWKDGFERISSTRNDMQGFSISCCSKNPLALNSVHKHHKSGLDYKIRHVCIDLRHEPNDKA